MQFSLPSILKLTAGIGFVLSVSGCSIMDIGEPDYGCTGLPDGVKCMSTREVYNLTNDGYVPSRVDEEADNASKQVTTVDDASGGVGEGEPDPNDVVSNYVAPRLPDQPIPIRTPAQVMRVWIAPWEDERGDLIVTGHLYTEVEPRRWVIGEQAANTQPTLRPLQRIQQTGDE